MIRTTFLSLVTEAKKKYNTDQTLVIFEIMFSLSKIVTNKLAFTQHRQNQIDFGKTKFFKLLDQYFNENKPLDLIIKKTKFLGINLDISNNVLVPRIETEEVALEAIKLINQYKCKKVADLCCGSGNIAIAIKKNTKASVTAVDINPDATKCARHNAIKNKVILKAITGDFYTTLLKNKLKFDAIVCNPPYIGMDELDKSMLKYETKISFNNSKDPLFFYKTIIDNYKTITNDKFVIVFEIGYDQKSELTSILNRNKLLNKSYFISDMNGKDRILVIRS